METGVIAVCSEMTWSEKSSVVSTCLVVMFICLAKSVRLSVHRRGSTR